MVHSSTTIDEVTTIETSSRADLACYRVRILRSPAFLSRTVRPTTLLPSSIHRRT